MNADLINISSIESWINSWIDGKVSEHTFFGMSVPENFDSSWSDLVMVDCSNAITDKNAFGTGTVLIMLYAKPLSSGKKNVAVLNNLEKKLNAALATARNEHYNVSRRETFCDYDTQNRLHYNVVVLNITIY